MEVVLHIALGGRTAVEFRVVLTLPRLQAGRFKRMRADGLKPHPLAPIWGFALVPSKSPYSLRQALDPALWLLFAGCSLLRCSLHSPAIPAPFDTTRASLACPTISTSRVLHRRTAGNHCRQSSLGMYTIPRFLQTVYRIARTVVEFALSTALSEFARTVDWLCVPDSICFSVLGSIQTQAFQCPFPNSGKQPGVRLC